MLTHYLSLALRHMRREKVYAAITILGLAFGIASSLLILLFVQDERSFDRFHTHADRIYRVVNGETLLNTAALAPALVSDIPEVEQAVRLSKRWGEVLVTHNEEQFYEKDFFFTDPALFEVFSFPLLQGNPETALERPFTIVLSEATSAKLFGSANPIGQTVAIEGSWGAYPFEVTGVIANTPHNSHFQYSVLASFATRYETEPRPETMDSWVYVRELTYVLLKQGATTEAAQAGLSAMLESHHPSYKSGMEETYAFQALTDIHLHSRLESELAPNSDPIYLYIFSVVAIFILVLACVNYINLASARSSRRGREVGLRKALGAERRMLVQQFLAESLLISLFSIAFGLALVETFLPIFNELTGKALNVPYGSGGFWLILLWIVALVSLGAGSYPAFLLARLSPVVAHRGMLATKPKRPLVRNSLVVFQFVVSVVLIIGTLVVQEQLAYLQDKRLGLDAEQVVVLDTRRAVGRENASVLRDALLQQPQVLGVSMSSSQIPSREDHDRGLALEGVEWQDQPEQYRISVDTSFFSFMGVAVIKGEHPQVFRKEEQTDVWVNEAFVEANGLDDPIDKTFRCCFRPTAKIVGVVSDFHYRSVKEEIEPLIIMMASWVSHVYVRVESENLASTLPAIQTTWKEVVPDYPMDYHFLDEQFDQLYQAEDRLARVFGLFAGLAILIACLGLFGLAAFIAEQRTKEIGIRKVLGATVGHIVVLLSNQFLRLVVIAVIVAFPLAYVAMKWWLQDFAYPVSIEATLFMGAGLAALGIAVCTVAFQALQAALANPVDSLRHE